jgi:Protein of unknown function (DUF3313)
MGVRIVRQGAGRRRGAGLCLTLLIAGCATAPLESAGSLASYESFVPSDNLLTKARLKVRKDALLGAKTVRILPTTLAGAAAHADLTDTERRLVSNAVDRALCVGLSDRFAVVPTAEPADLTIRAVITNVGVTDKVAAGASRATSVAASVVTKLLLPNPVPTPVPRIPIGMGSLSVEAEALDRAGVQQAAMLWARGADAFTTKPKVSSASDAYDLATAFGSDFSRLLDTANDPIKALPAIPSVQRIGFAMGAPPKYAACETFGRSPGVAGLLGDAVGLPPDWTDKGTAPANAAQAQQD